MNNKIQNILTLVAILLMALVAVFLYFSNALGLTLAVITLLIVIFIIFMIDDDSTHYIGG